MRYFFHPAAESEHLETVAYYESQRAGLGASYLTEFENVVSNICNTPHRYPVAMGPDIRRARMKKFPFTVLFREISGSVQILALAHHRRRPEYWIERLQ
uniref:ParE toxin of type II toxin-antitoxin system, parDE n=1 Tax=Candidatus Kentrum eta TaxID=2126337 RepID=A0A450UGT0_9GAMM|nr:MAG: ParE toxin of type II toxin-antitoxin system, parDE [Candidatus Kentron sp. H]VFJ92934.1 MAG: ParE toxin of type II toxin-antitoxin system, parDE [Candidatus Kentron sp. H]VFJ99549.1 MAG: ParE toxin of type II toxin-antitoxin system, parDE [Candidatus Kentron sp. H]